MNGLLGSEIHTLGQWVPHHVTKRSPPKIVVTFELIMCEKRVTNCKITIQIRDLILLSSPRGVTARVFCNLKMTSFLYQQLSNHGGNLKKKKPMMMNHYIYKDALHNVPFVKYDSPVTAQNVAHNSQC